MIKFFRKIRYDLMEKNKTGKPALPAGRYFKYAIGEIVLVVIGILIALSINNWNETRKIEKRSINYMKSLIIDLKTDVNEFNQNIKSYETDIIEIERVLTSNDYKKLEVDSIMHLVIDYYRIDKTTKQTYEKIKNGGLLESLGSENINKAINDYYNLNVIYYQNGLLWDKKYTDKAYDFWFYNKNFEASSIRNYNTNSIPFLTNEKGRKANLITLIESMEGRNYLRNGLVRKNHMLKRTTEIKLVAEDLTEMLAKELDKK